MSPPIRLALFLFVSCFIGCLIVTGNFLFIDTGFYLSKLPKFFTAGAIPSYIIFGWYEEFIRKCPHGVRQGQKSNRCSQCVKDRQTAVLLAEQKRIRCELEKKDKERKKVIADAATKLRFEEITRLRDILLPTLAELYALSPQRFEDEIANMFQRLGYEVKQTPYSNDYGRDAIMHKDGKKILLECKRYAKDGLSTRPHLQKFHSAMTTDKAHKGFFVTTGTFTGDALDFAKDVNIETVDGKSLIKFMLESKPEASSRDDYSTLCPECMDRVKHRLRAPTSVICKNGHSVQPSIKMDELLGISKVQHRPRCPECHANLRLIDGKNGRFWGCTKFPSCHYTKSWNAG